jgi:N-acetylglucosaminyl-diphospho-decaprenol L-rhamnosyltransferase
LVVSDLAIVIVSYNSAEWLSPCLRSVYAHAGDIDLEVVVVDNGSTDGSTELVEANFPAVKVVHAENRGFAYGNNLGVRAVQSRYVLFLNADTEVLIGAFSDLVAALDERPEVGLAGVRQLTPEGELYPTIRRFPNALRTFFEALGSERFPFRASWLGERELDFLLYEQETQCDWTSGSFMVARADALAAAGPMDERFFMYCEEPDLCLRVKRAGWEVRHLPFMTIIHHAGKSGWSPKLAAQDAFARKQYMHKHYSRIHRAAATAAFALGLGLRALLAGRSSRNRSEHRAAMRAALRTLLGQSHPPYGHPPA